MTTTLTRTAAENVAYRLARVEAIRQYEAGWLDGEGKVISELAIAAAVDISGYLDESAYCDEHWAIFPTEEGGVSFECSYTGPIAHVTSIEVTPGGHTDVSCLVLRHEGDAKEFAFDEMFTHRRSVQNALAVRERLIRTVTDTPTKTKDS